MIGQFVEMVDAHYGVIQSTSGSTSLVRVLSTLDRELLKTNATVATHRHSHAVRQRRRGTPLHGASTAPLAAHRWWTCCRQRRTPPSRPCR